MEVKKKTKAARFWTGALTGCILFGASFLGAAPSEAAASFGSFGASRLPMPSVSKGSLLSGAEKRSRKTDKETFQKDWDWEWDWDEDDWNWDWDWDEEEEKAEEKARLKEYAAFGVEKDGKNYYYKGEKVKIFLDHRPDSSFYVLDMNPKGTVSIRIVRSAKGKIKGVAYLTEEEAKKLLEDGLEALLEEKE